MNSKKWHTYNMQLRKMAFCLLSIFVSFGCTPSLMLYLNEAENIPTDQHTGWAQELETSIPPFDADVFFSSNGTILEKQSVDQLSEKDLLSDRELYELFADRGFNLYPIVAYYTVEGTYIGETEIVTTGKEKHPFYETSYVCENGEVWTITFMNGSFTALPEYYNFNSTSDAITIVAESIEVISYDSRTNTYYKTIPNEEQMHVIILEEINAVSLNELSSKGIKG